MQKRFFAAVLALWLFGGCHSVEQTAEEFGADASVMAGIAALTGAISAESTQESALAAYAPLSLKTIFSAVTTCGTPAAKDTCNSKKKSATYTDCAASLSHTYSGTVSLAYTDSACALSLTQSVTRTLTMSRTLQFSGYPRFNGTVVSTTSEDHADYRGATLGGGSKLTSISVDNVYDLEVLGLHKVLKNSKDRSAYDISIRTVSPIQIEGALSGNRMAKGGELEVIHNQGQYVATMSPSNLQYNSTTCCHPVAGSVTVIFTGKAIGQGTIEFPGPCGFATLDRGEGAVEIPLHGCE